jgi:hypothetical protein
VDLCESGGSIRLVGSLKAGSPHLLRPPDAEGDLHVLPRLRVMYLLSVTSSDLLQSRLWAAVCSIKGASLI